MADHTDISVILTEADTDTGITAAGTDLDTAIVCGLCGESKKHVAKEQRLCAPCNALRSRMKRLVAKNPNMQPPWGTSEDRKKFYQIHAATTGAELASVMVDTSTVSMAEESSHGFGTSGEWLDEQDLKERYEKKPEQLSNILQFARKLMHPTRKVTVYEDLKFDSSDTRKGTYAFEHKRKAESEQQVSRKKMKMPQTGARAAIEGPKVKAPKEPKDGARPLTPNQSKTIQNKKVKLDAAIQKLHLLICDAEGANSSQYVAAAVTQRARKFHAQAASASAAAEVALGEDWKGPAKEVTKDVTDQFAEAKAAAERLKAVIALADRMTGEDQVGETV